MKKIGIIFLIGITVLGMVACNKKSGTDSENTSVSISEPIQPLVYYAPLTGEEVEHEITQRAVAVMINNQKKARPQSGISQADMVYELLSEADITRWLAIFQSELPEKIGPIRSARDYYIKIAAGYNAFYICHGQSPAAEDLMQSGAIDALNGINYDGKYFHRDQTRVAPHNSYTSASDISDAAEALDIRMIDQVRANIYEENGFSGDTEAKDATYVKLKYSSNDDYNVVYTYDETKKGYIRSQGGVQTTDRENDEMITVQNVFIVKTEHNIIDNYGRRSIDLQSGGQGYLLQNGKMLEVTWMNDSGRLVPTKNGEVIPYIPGKTWINVVEDKESAVNFTTPN